VRVMQDSRKVFVVFIRRWDGEKVLGI